MWYIVLYLWIIQNVYLFVNIIRYLYLFVNYYNDLIFLIDLQILFQSLTP